MIMSLSTQLSAEASRMKVQEDFALQQASEQRKFAELNKDISESLLQVINSIEDLDIAAGILKKNYSFSTTILS